MTHVDIMRGERQLAALVGDIYEAAADPDRLADLSALVAPQFGTESSIIHTCTDSSLEMRDILSFTRTFDAWAWSAYAQHYHDRNVWFQRGIRKGPSVVVICEELVSDRELLRSEWYDYCQKLDWHHCLGIGVAIDTDLVGGIGFHRPRSAQPFEEADRKKAQLLLPHLERALQINHRISRLAHERNVALDVLDGLALGLLFVAVNGHVLFANRIAERLLLGRHALSVRRGRLQSTEPGRQRDLERLIGEAARTSGGKGLSSGGILSLPRQDGAPLTVLVSPFRSRTMGYGPGMPAAVVMFSDPDARRPVSPRVLMQVYRLTKAEARLLAALLAGQALAEYAGHAGISINTAKSQMRDVFLKTGQARQVDLVRAVMGDPAIRLARDDGDGSRGD